MKTYKLKDIISQGTKDLFYIWWQELKAVVKDQGVLIFFILVPLGYPLLYTFIYTNETVREVPAAVVDNNRSSLSREYLRLVCNIRANSISATDIVLQGGCVVDYVHCNGTLRYDATCRIKKIEGDCIQKRM